MSKYMNLIFKFDNAISMFAIGLLAAGFLSDVKWTVLGRAVGVL